ncbi:MAG: hypothetical protein ACT4OZ_17445 [Gemmatimonadota bacterium]
MSLTPHVMQGTLGLVLCLSAPAGSLAQTDSSVTPTPKLIARTLLGETALEVRTGTGLVRLAIGGASATIVLNLRASDARMFADSLSRALAVRRRVRRTAWNVNIEERGTASGSMSVSLRIAGRDSTMTLFAADETLASIRQVLTPGEALVLSRHLRAASAAATVLPVSR